jgi:hypothetical protein
MIIVMYALSLTFHIHIIHDFITKKLKLWRFSFVCNLYIQVFSVMKVQTLLDLTFSKRRP